MASRKRLGLCRQRSPFEPARHHGFLEMWIKHDAATSLRGLRRHIVQVHVIVGNATIPIGPARPEISCTACSTKGIEQLARTASMKLASFRLTCRVRKPPAEKAVHAQSRSHPWKTPRAPASAPGRACAARWRQMRPGSRPACASAIRAPAALPTRSHHMQAVARVVQHLGHSAAIEILQTLRKPLADQPGRCALLPGRIKPLGDVVSPAARMPARAAPDRPSPCARLRWRRPPGRPAAGSEPANGRK